MGPTPARSPPQPAGWPLLQSLRWGVLGRARHAERRDGWRQRRRPGSRLAAAAQALRRPLLRALRIAVLAIGVEPNAVAPNEVEANEVESKEEEAKA